MTLSQLHAETRAAIRARIASGATSQTQLAGDTFLSQPYISLVLSGRREARPGTLDELAEAAGIRIEARITTPEPRAPEPTSARAQLTKLRKRRRAEPIPTAA